MGPISECMEKNVPILAYKTFLRRTNREIFSNLGVKREEIDRAEPS